MAAEDADREMRDMARPKWTSSRPARGKLEDRLRELLILRGSQ
jgi:hypothetical protein